MKKKEREKQKEKEKEKEKEEGEKQITVAAGPFWGSISNYSYRRASAGELILHYITVGPFPGIRNVILFAAMVIALLENGLITGSNFGFLLGSSTRNTGSGHCSSLFLAQQQIHILASVYENPGFNFVFFMQLVFDPEDDSRLVPQSRDQFR